VGYYGTLNGKLYAVNVNNGNVLWSYATDSNKVNHDKYFTREEQFNQYSISLLTQDLGKQVAIFYEMGGIFSKPAVKDRLLVFTSSEGSVNCLILPEKI
jgi:outer membrane protein assembly factor BamB